ncbi:MAG: hypothetical protein QJT81_21970 [Candidatus Thiothrix putei]|uniref:Uncharacterized protein n=1 Tax=Candidatus Thiothrix putei TaxID=3080811 RepID=A0AA95HGL3_9GAMM|nr:MAG: hypothetical protein QJT81_21970 [Candidatus Thiothrix putei]
MKTYRWLLAALLFFTPLLQAGTPDHLMWIGKDQDALILGEVLELTSADTCTVKVMAVFPQTKEWLLHEGQTLTLKGFDTTDIRLDGSINSNKYLMSLQREDDHYRPHWGLYALSPGSSSFANARLIDPYSPLQYMISTGGRYPLPSYVFPEPPEAVENPQIPTDLLKQIPTRELIEIWLEYPHLHLVHSSKTLQAGMDKLRTTFNGLPELLQRDDVADVLFDVFREKNLDNLTIKPDSDADKQLANQHAALALLLAQPEIQERLPFYQRWYLRWQVAERLEAMAETWLGGEPAFVCYRALADALDQ